MTWWLNKKYDLTGRKFGKLTVAKIANTVGRRRWKCKCECGKTTTVSSNNLKSKNVISCGCALQGCNRGLPFKWLYNRILKDRRKLNVSLSYKEFLEFTKIQECHYCGKSIIWSPYSNNKKYAGGSNLDRKNSALGYSKNNCVVCCPRCNWSKSNRFTYKEWVILGNIIRSWNDS